MNTWNDFVADLTRVDALKFIREDAIREWGENIPTTLLFSMLGKGVAEKFDEFLPDDRIYIFDHVETGMREGDMALKTFIATGLLEALYSRVSDDVLLWGRIDTQLGELSRKYLDAWRKL